jgi:amidohydrolase
MAGGAFFDITVTGKGAHGAHPDAGMDPVIAACHIATAAQTIVARNLNPADPAVISITKIGGGDAYNVIPETATMSGTARFFSRKVGDQIEEAVKRVVAGVAAGLGCTAEIDWRLIFAPTVNTADATDAYVAAAAELVGEEKVMRGKPPSMGSEDFSFMMEQVPGAYILVGNGDGAMPHNPRYMFNDEAIPFGAALYARIVERGLKSGD